jgi:predicted  nucleic acid-binding Zn-ribbon protein
MLINSLILFFVVLIFYQIYLEKSRIFESFQGSSDSIIILNSQIKDINTDISAMKKDIGDLKDNVVVLNSQVKAMNSKNSEDVIKATQGPPLTVTSAVS